MEAREYFAATRPAVLHLLDALREYDSLTEPPSLADHTDESGVIHLDQHSGREYLSGLRDSMALDVAKATLCGALCQVAYTAINLFSESAALTADPGAFGIKDKSRLSKFCVGRNVHGIPAGLLIYAARVQYSHWDEGELTNQVVIKILDALRDHYRTDVTYDLAYVWHWPGPRPITHQVLRHELEWFQYDDYLSDMRLALPAVTIHSG